MEAKVIVITNWEAIQEAKSFEERFGSVHIPEPIIGESNILFHIDDIKMAYITSEGYLRVLIHDDYIDLVYNEGIYKRLLERFK
jgi:hypothetical protein